MVPRARSSTEWLLPSTRIGLKLSLRYQRQNDYGNAGTSTATSTTGWARTRQRTRLGRMARRARTARRTERAVESRAHVRRGLPAHRARLRRHAGGLDDLHACCRRLDRATERSPQRLSVATVACEAVGANHRTIR